MTLKAKLGLVIGSVVLVVLCLYISAKLQLRHETMVRVQAEQQLLMSLSLMVEPFLVQNKVEQVKGHLLATSFSSTLPIKAILVYQADGNLFAATQFPRELFNFSPTRDLTGQKALQDGSTLLWSTVMVTPASMSYFDSNKVAAEGSTLGYVAIQISPLRLSQLWWWQSGLWGTVLVTIVVVALWLQRRIFYHQHQRWQAFLRQIQDVLQRPGVDEKKLLAFDTAELNQLTRQLCAQQQQLQQQLQQQSQLEQQQGQHSQAEREQLELNHQQQLKALAEDLKHSQYRLRQWQQLAVLGQQGQVEQQTQLLNWLQTQELLDKIELQPETVWFPQWLASQVALWQSELQLEKVHVVVVEDPALSLSEVQFFAQHTAELLKQIVWLVMQDLQQNELSLHVNLQAFSENKLLLQFDHSGQSKAIRQVISTTDPSAVVPQLCARLMSRLGAKLAVSALEDLGCSVRVELTLTAVSSQELPMYQTAVYLDANPIRAAVLKQSVYSIAEQVIHIQQLQQLQLEVQHRLVDLVLVQLPGPEAADQLWQDLNQLTVRTPVLAFCEPTQLNDWQALLQCPVLSNPMLSAHIRHCLAGQATEQPLRLLVVDDNTTNLAFVKAILGQQQFEVDTAATGAEAIRLAKSGRYQLILMDIQLPDMSGVMATHMIRQLPQHQDTVIMAFTAHASAQEIQQFHQAGMNDVVIKPLDAHKVADLIRRCQQLSCQNLIPG